MVTPLRKEVVDPTAAPKPAPTSVPRTPAVIAAEQRFEWVRNLSLLVVVAYGAVSMFTEWWPVDWLNLAQQRVFGSYSPKMSGLLFIAVAITALALVLSMLTDVVTRRIARRDVASNEVAVPRATPPAVRPALSQSSLIVRMALGTLVVIWIVAAAAFFWFDARQRGDNNADYVPLDLDAQTLPQLSPGDHASVRGIVLASRVVTFHSDSSSTRPSYFLIPVVPNSWHAGEATHVVLRVDSLSELPGFQPVAARRPWMLPEQVLGRSSGSAPLIARSEFEKMGVMLAPDHRVLEVVASRAGKPVQRDVDYLERVLWVAGIGSVVLSLMYGAAFAIQRRRERAVRG